MHSLSPTVLHNFPKLNFQAPSPASDTDISKFFKIQTMFSCITFFWSKKERETKKRRGRKLWKKDEETLKKIQRKFCKKEEGNSVKKDEINSVKK